MVDWDGIIDREGPAVWRTVCRLLTRRADAEECFQETFLAALQLWRREPMRSPRAALQRLATARAIDRLRQRYRAAGHESDEAPASLADPSPSPPDRAAAAELAETLRAALSDLPGKQADAFCLHCLDGYSYREVADALGLSVDAVGVLLHRARGRLRDLLASRAPAPRSGRRPLNVSQVNPMSHDAPPPSPADRALDEMTAALRDAGAAESAALPPEVRRSTLEALWVADANRYETRSARNFRLSRYAAALVVLALLVAAGGVFFHLSVRAWERRNDVQRQYGMTRTTVAPPAATHTLATQPADADPTDADPLPPVVTGKAVFLGVAPTPATIDVSAVPECRAHAPLRDESLLVGTGGGLANVVVSLKRADGPPLSTSPPARAAVLDQKGCQFIPHVLVTRVGQPLLIKNSDNFLHNVHSLTTKNPAFNFGQPTLNPGTPMTPMWVPERFRIKCDVHPWMSAYVNVFDHPYFAVSAPDGSFAIPGTPPDGQYIVTAWHEKLGEKQATVVIRAGRAVNTDFVFDGGSAAGGITPDVASATAR